jgi:ankyrin repeat protein
MGPTPITHVSAVHRDTGYTALHWAIYHRIRRVVRLLIDAKANVNAQDDDGCAFPFRRRRMGSRVPAAVCRGTPLHWAANTGRSDVILDLLLSGAVVAIQDSEG